MAWPHRTSRGAWSDAATAMVRKEWAEGLSASQISKKLKEIGVTKTRNAVIGRVHRLRLAARATPAQTRSEVHRARIKNAVRRMRSPTIKPAPLVCLAAELAAIAALPALASFGDTGCPYMPGDPQQDTAVCGRMRAPCSVYCADHARLCYTPSAN